MNFTHTGDPTSIELPEGRSLPVCGSMRKSTRCRCPGWTIRRRPSDRWRSSAGLALRRFVANRAELARLGVDGKHRDAVVAAVRAVDELPDGWTWTSAVVRRHGIRREAWKCFPAVKAAATAS